MAYRRFSHVGVQLGWVDLKHRVLSRVDIGNLGRNVLIQSSANSVSYSNPLDGDGSFFFSSSLWLSEVTLSVHGLFVWHDIIIDCDMLLGRIASVYLTTINAVVAR